MSTILWMKLNPHEVLLYQEPATSPFRPFSLVIQREFQLDWLIKYGNGKCIAIDGTANTQKYKVICLNSSQYILIVLKNMFLIISFSCGHRDLAVLNCCTTVCKVSCKVLQTSASIFSLLSENSSSDTQIVIFGIRNCVSLFV